MYANVHLFILTFPDFSVPLPCLMFAGVGRNGYLHCSSIDVITCVHKLQTMLSQVLDKNGIIMPIKGLIINWYLGL